MKPTPSIEHSDRPVDRTAARQFFPGIKEQIAIPTSVVWSPDPFETKPDPCGLSGMIGGKRGKMTVMGYVGHVDRPGKEPRRYWSCRCTCGGYELRNQVTLTSRNSPDDQCARCRAVSHATYLRSRGS